MIRSMLPLAVALAASSFLVGASASAASVASIPSLAAQSGPVTQEATGRGASAAEARKEAIVAALRQIVGEYVEADVQLADDEVVKNEILSFSNAGGVKSEQVGEPRMVDDEVEITMRVTVEPKPLVARVKGAAKAGARLDGPELAAEIAAAKDDYEAKQRVLEKAFANLPDAFMTIRIVDSEGKDTTGIDRKLVEVDRKTGEATIKIPVVLGFDSAVWKNNVYPALDQVLTAAAASKANGGQIVDRGKHQASYALERVPYTGTPTITSPSIRGGLSDDRITIALLRENLGKGRQLTFDVFEIDADLLPFVSTVRTGQRTAFRWNYPPRQLRVRLLDGDGEAVDGTDADLYFVGKYGAKDKTTFAIAAPVNGPGANDLLPMTPFVSMDQIVWNGGGSRMHIAPLWMPVFGLNNSHFASPEMVVPVSFKLPTEDLELIERIEVELIGPGGTN